MLDWTLLDDDDFQVTLAFGGIGATTVTLKQSGPRVKPLPDEKAFLDKALAQLESVGVDIHEGDVHTKQVVRDFALRVARRVDKHTPTGLTPEQSMMFICTSAMMRTAYAGGGLTPNHFNMLLQLVSSDDHQEKLAASEALADQYKMVIGASPDSMTALIAHARDFPIEARRGILIACIAISLVNGEPNKDQRTLLDPAWLDCFSPATLELKR